MNFTLLSDRPTDDFPRSDRRCRDHGAWLPSHYFDKRKTSRKTFRTERGWD